jgi:hypothetical protein
MQRLVIEVEGLNGSAEAFRPSASDGIAFLAHSARERTRERMPEQAPNFGAVSGQQRCTQAIQVVEHQVLHIRPK